MTKIIDRATKAAALDITENDNNLSSLAGINEADATASRTVDVNDQNKTIEFSSVGAVAVTLDAIADIYNVADGALNTDDFKVTLFNTGAATTVTITPDGADALSNGEATIVLSNNEYVTLQTDSTGGVWNIINSSDARKLGGTAAASYIKTTGNYTIAGDLTLSGAVDLTGTWEIGSTQVTLTAAEINLAKFYVNTKTGSIAASSGSASDYAHGLGTDDVDMGLSLLGSTNQDITGYICRPDGQWVAIGDWAQTFPSPSAPAAGNVRVYIYNGHSATQTVTAKFWVRARA